MEMWGTELFNGNGTKNLLEDYEVMLGYGVSSEEAYKRVKLEYHKNYEGKTDEDVFWLSIALYQWQNGILKEEVKQNALRCIADGRYLDFWKENDKAEYKKRKKTLETLEDKLLHEVNPVRTIEKGSLYYKHDTNWKVGDLLVLQELHKICPYKEYNVKDASLNEVILKMYQKFFLLRVIKVVRKPITRLYPELGYISSPIVMLYDWYGNVIPSEDKIRQLPFRKVVVQRNQDGICEVEAGVSLDFYERDEQYAKVTVHSNDPKFLDEVPKFYQENSNCSSESAQTLVFMLPETFADMKDKKVIWYYGKEELKPRN